MPNSYLHHLMNDSDEMFTAYKSVGGRVSKEVYVDMLRVFFLHTLNAQLGHDAEICGLSEQATRDEDGFHIYPNREVAHKAFADEVKITHEEAHRVFRSVDAVHAYS